MNSLYCSVALALLVGVSPAKAAERFGAEGMFCDTPEAATEFVQKWDRHNAKETADAINTAAGKNVCELGRLIVEPVMDIGQPLDLSTGKWQMVKLNVWGAQINGILVTVSVPSTVYTYHEVDPQKLGQAI